MPTLNYGSIHITNMSKWYVNEKPRCKKRGQINTSKYYKRITRYKEIQDELMDERVRRGRKSICRNWNKLYKE